MGGADRQLRPLERFAACFRDSRNPVATEFTAQELENRFNEEQLALFADRTRIPTLPAIQLRLSFSSVDPPNVDMELADDEVAAEAAAVAPALRRVAALQPELDRYLRKRTSSRHRVAAAIRKEARRADSKGRWSA